MHLLPPPHPYHVANLKTRGPAPSSQIYASSVIRIYPSISPPLSPPPSPSFSPPFLPLCPRPTVCSCLFPSPGLSYTRAQSKK
jgi:hypothetical protein